ncbi:hypothetical protein ACS0TY_018832 [Phlomoides rotata]
MTGSTVSGFSSCFRRFCDEGLIVSTRKESLQNFKQPWAHEHEPVNNLLDAVKAIKPTALIGTSGVGKQFTKEVVEAMASFNEVDAFNS